MNLVTDHVGDLAVVRVNETRLTYPLLADFTSAVASVIGGGHRKVLLELSAVTYVDSATVGCLMDLCRQAVAAGATLKLSGVQKRVDTILAMTGVLGSLEIHPDEPSALKSFGN